MSFYTIGKFQYLNCKFRGHIRKFILRHPYHLIFAEDTTAFNEIALCAMKSSLCSDEICLADEIKSVPCFCRMADFITK